MSKPEVVVVDYGVGNLLSVQRGLEHCGAEVIFASSAESILRASKIVLPGVGAFGNAMAALQALDLVEALRTVAARGTPLLGICLGMQLLLDESEEFGLTKGLGIIPGRVVAMQSKSADGKERKIPHIGWNGLLPSASANWHNSVLGKLSPGEAVYFVHSFEAVPDDPLHKIAICLYDGHQVTAVVQKGQTTGCQFHPEKSGAAGLGILEKFCGD